jgi:hypothetical protein
VELCLLTVFCIVSFKEHANAGTLLQPALQFLNVEMRFLMLAEGSTLGISFLFFLESLCECYDWFAAAFWPVFCEVWICV